MSIEGKVVAITGGARGIGAVTATLLAHRGARVVLAGRDERALQEVTSRIVGAGGEAAAQVCDVTDPASVRGLVTAAVERFGRLDVFVANAGVVSAGPLAEGDPRDWDAMIDVNLRGVLHGIAAALPVFTRQNSGHWVCVTSTSSIKWVPGQAVYAATKAGARALCDVMRQEVGPEIRVSTICPGATLTEFITGSGHEAAGRMAEIAMDPSGVAEAIAYAIGQPADVDVGEIVVRSARQP